MGYITSSVDYGRPTYKGIRDSLQAELNLYQEMSTVDEGKWVGWILQAEEQITSLMNVEMTVRLRLKATYDVYKFVENPKITSIAWADNGGGTFRVTVTTEYPHKLKLGDYVRLYFNTGFNEFAGELVMVASVPTPTTFGVWKARRVTGVTNATPMVVTIPDHEWDGLGEESMVILGVLGCTAANGAWYGLEATLPEGGKRIIAIDGKDTISIDGTGNGAYTSGGYAWFASEDASTSTYVGGGSWYRENEIPAFIKRIKRIRFVDGGSVYDIDLGDTDAVTDLEISDSSQYAGASTHTYPARASVVRRNDSKILRIYPAITADTDCDVYGFMRVDPQFYASDDIDCRIHLDQQYAAIIREYVKSCMFSHMHKYAESAAILNAFYSLVGRRQTKESNYTRIRITYR